MEKPHALKFQTPSESQHEHFNFLNISISVMMTLGRFTTLVQTEIS